MSNSDELHASLNWTPIFMSMLESGALGHMSCSALRVYIAIKLYAEYESGDSIAPVSQLMHDLSLSKAQVTRSIRELAELEYLSRTKIGRRNVYKLRDKVDFTDPNGALVATAAWDHAPGLLRPVMKELRRFRMTANIDGATVINITIHNLTIGNYTENGDIHSHVDK